MSKFGAITGKYDKFDFDVVEHTIGGKMVAVSFSVDEIEFELNQSDDEWRKKMRESLIENLVSEILNRNMCNITMMKNPINQSVDIRAYMYLAPNDQIKILREFKK